MKVTVTTTTTTEVNFPLYLIDKNGLDSFLFINEKNSVKISATIGAIYTVTSNIQVLLDCGYTITDREGFMQVYNKCEQEFDKAYAIINQHEPSDNAGEEDDWQHND